MPRYFFHLTGSTSFIDKDGIELADEDAAWSEAVSSCGHLLQDIDGRLPERSEITLRVADEGGQHVATLRFIGRRQRDAVLGEVAERVADQVDVALDWIHDVYRPARYNGYAHELGLAALVGLQDGDSIGRGLVVRHESQKPHS